VPLETMVSDRPQDGFHVEQQQVYSEDHHLRALSLRVGLPMHYVPLGWKNPTVMDSAYQMLIGSVASATPRFQIFGSNHQAATSLEDCVGQDCVAAQIHERFSAQRLFLSANLRLAPVFSASQVGSNLPAFAGKLLKNAGATNERFPTSEPLV